MLWKLASFTATKGAFCYSQRSAGRVCARQGRGLGVAKPYQTSKKKKKSISCPVISTLPSHHRVQTKGHCRDPLLGLCPPAWALLARREVEWVGKPCLWTAARATPTNPSPDKGRADCPGTISVRQRLFSPRTSQTRTIHFSPSQLPAAKVFIACICNCRRSVVPKPPQGLRISAQLPYLRSWGSFSMHIS